MASLPISDMHVFPLKREDGRLALLGEADHLLRRFGQLEVVDLAAGTQTEYSLRAEADRFVFAIEGECRVQLVDLREVSPTRGARASLALAAKDPHGLLVPFGAACSLQTDAGCRLVTLSTHSQAHPADRVVPPGELPS